MNVRDLGKQIPSTDFSNTNRQYDNGIYHHSNKYMSAFHRMSNYGPKSILDSSRVV